MGGFGHGSKNVWFRGGGMFTHFFAKLFFALLSESED